MLAGWIVAVLASGVALVGWLRVGVMRRDQERLEAVARDFERVRERAAETAASQEKLRRALDAIPQGVVIGDDSGTVLVSNVRAAEFLAARHGEALVEAAIRDLLVEAAQGPAEGRTLELFGPPRRVLEVVAHPLPGATGGSVVVVDDVTERRRLEAVRRDFVANISHELKTPVGAIGLLAETVAGEDDPAVIHRLAERMVAEAFRVGRTLDDLLELSRIESGTQPTREPVAVSLAMAEAADRMRPAAELRDIRIRVQEPARNLNLVGDRRQLVSALSNLLDNAVKYSDAGAEVVLAAEATFDSGGGRWVELQVRDNGLGIPVRDLERVFERFYRVDRARSRDTGGTGLGLAIVRHVVSNHDGEVSVTSREGEGSTFTLRLPAGPGPQIVPPIEENQ